MSEDVERFEAGEAQGAAAVWLNRRVTELTAQDVKQHVRLHRIAHHDLALSGLEQHLAERVTRRGRLELRKHWSGGDGFGSGHLDDIPVEARVSIIGVAARRRHRVAAGEYKSDQFEMRRRRFVGSIGTPSPSALPDHLGTLRPTLS